MKMRCIRYSAATFLLSCMLAHAQADFTNTIAVSSAYITNLMAELNIPGVSVALVNSQEVVWAQGFGLADVAQQTPVTTNTTFYIGSVTKNLTALMAMQLRDARVVNLNVSVTNYLPEFSMLPRYPGDDPMTIRNCLNHHSGMPGDIYNGGISSSAYWPDYTAWLIDYFSLDYPLYPANTVASYCNSGFNIVGEIVARHDSNDYQVCAANRVFTPLDMLHSSFDPSDPSVADHLATGYINGEAMPPMIFNMPATGGAISRPLDMANIIRMYFADGLFNGTNFISTNVMAEMGKSADAPLDLSSYFQPGLGWDTVCDPVMTYAGPAWAKDGSVGSFGALLEILPEKKLGVFIVMNTESAGKYGMARTMLKEALKERDQMLPPPCPVMPDCPVTNLPLSKLLPLEGYYITATGVNRFYAEADGTLSCIIGMQTNDTRTYQYRALTNGLFTDPAHTNLFYAFTNIAGYSVIKAYGATESERDRFISEGFGMALLGTRYIPSPISTTWSNRLPKVWIINNLLHDDYMWLDASLPAFQLQRKNNILWTDIFPNDILTIASDTLAFVNGLSARGDSCLRVMTNHLGHESLTIGGYHGIDADTLTVLTNGMQIATSLTPHTSALFRVTVAVAGESYLFLTPTNAPDVALRLYDSTTGAMVGMGSGHLALTNAQAGDYFLILSSAHDGNVQLKTVETTYLKTCMRQFLDQNPNVPGISVYVSGPDFPPMAVTEGYGYLAPLFPINNVPLRPEDHFHMASISKTYTAAGIFKLQDRLLLSITNTIADLAPELCVPRNDEITVEMLLAQRSGLPDANNTPWIDDKLISQPLLEFSVEEIVAIASNMYPELMFEPGTAYHYTDTGYNILARIIENVSGTNYQHFIAEELLAPLGLTNTFVPMNNEYDIPEPAAHSYQVYDGVYQDRSSYSPSAEFGCGSIIANTRDLATFMQQLFCATNVISESSKALMMQQISGNYGLGCMYTDGLGWGHSGAMWGFLSTAAADPATDVAVVAMMNFMYADDQMDRFVNAQLALNSLVGIAKNLLGYDAHDYGMKPPRSLLAHTTLREQDPLELLPMSGNFPTNWFITGLPDGLDYDIVTGLITGILPAAGTYTVEMTPQNQFGSRTSTNELVIDRGYTNTKAAVTALLNDMAANGDFVGLSLALVDGDEVAWQTGFGYADRENTIPATADTVYRIGSVSKMFTAVAALRQQDRGELDLADTMTNYLPQINLLARTDQTLPPIDYQTAPVTVRSLLNHLSGIPSTYIRNSMTTQPYGNYVDEVIGQMNGDYASYPVDFAPVYNNNAFELAARIVALAAQAPYAQHIHSNIFMALDMIHSGFDVTDAGIAPTLSVSYDWDLNRMPTEYLNMPGSGAALSSASDMARLIAMFLSEGEGPYAPLLTPDAMQAMANREATNAALHIGTRFFSPGLGWDTVEYPDIAYAGGGWSKNGATTTYGAFLGLATNQDLGVFVIHNSPGAELPTTVARTLLTNAIAEKSGLYPPAPAVLPDSPAISLAESNLQALAGAYVYENGYSLFEAGSNCLIYGGSVLYPRADGFFGATSSPPFLFSFTNVDTFTFAVLHLPYNNYIENVLLGERYEEGPLPAAWSNRMGNAYLVANMPDISYMRAHRGTMAAELRMMNGRPHLLIPSIFLDDYSGGPFSRSHIPFKGVDATQAFALGVGGKMACSIQAWESNAVAYLRAANYSYIETSAIAPMPLGQPTNLALTSNSTVWVSFAGRAGSMYNLQSANSNSVELILVNDQFAYEGDGTSGALINWLCPSNGIYYLGLTTREPGTYALTFNRSVCCNILDFDGDNISDLAVYHRPDGRWYIRFSGSGDIQVTDWGWEAAYPMPADYDGDGKTDIGVYDPAVGDWYLLLSGVIWMYEWGWPEALPVPGDYDGDGRFDVAVYDRATGAWYIRESSTGTLRIETWGWETGLPVPADYDGDGLTDVAVYWKDMGQWFIHGSAGVDILGKNWGWAGAFPEPADYDGDGKADIAVYYPTEGDWYIEYSGGGGLTRNWGWDAVYPVPGDYDGDGKADLAVYDQASGNWYILRSSDDDAWIPNWGWPEAWNVWPQFWINGIFPPQQSF
ncbi:MAG: hypothetical protein EOM20_06655 [Spartobacteria bacterium]|nr:hypothetical protein [Spartobacteria bacterium]